ncbi:lysophospholipid acyltransferase family protein [Pseudovibrio exalbescens]|uniref:lysophospholipid acyltransferase family protein n=1 Tax=Pseudovibrio exalbescens TaxID=197461 RepID=UPI0023659A37|nr:lysophospholipid acyltransferase family protein [Pseudovibrio exalbescens]MDD7911312.1 lysophospholipid acyltransferase family protein [Pseudovibrio exalbescens]
MLKKLGRHPIVLKLLGNALAYYLWLVRRTSTLTMEPANFYEAHASDQPFVLAMWHGQHFMVPFARPKDWPCSVMISRSNDGEINAIAASKLGIGLIRASGSQRQDQIAKRGGVRGFVAALRALKQGTTMGMTADVPKGPARKAGMGIVQLAKHSGRPLLPIAIATSRHYDFNSWDKASLNLPFSKIGLVFGEPIPVPEDASEADLEMYRLKLENAMNEATDRAYAIAKGRKS